MSDRSDNRLSEFDVLDVIEQIVRTTKKAYRYQHLPTIGSYLRLHYLDFNLANYGCKNLLQLIERYPERFKVKRSAYTQKGNGHVWIRLVSETKRKEGYEQTSPAPPPSKPKLRLMTRKEFDRLSQWLSETGAADRCGGSLRKTRQWLRRRDFLSLEGNSNLIGKLGGHCDCEMLFNVDGKWPHEYIPDTKVLKEEEAAPLRRSCLSFTNLH